MRRVTVVLAVVALVSLGLEACGSGQSGAVQAVQGYLDALVAKDSSRVSALSCADWESDAQVEVDSLEAVTPRLDGVSCSEGGTDGGATLVTCTGSMVLSYNGEDRSLDLSRRTYRVVQQGGDWLMCGYQQ
jgi:hypothetical protein